MRLRHLVVGCVACALGVAPAAAQWINHPTPGIPRTRDGKPNLAAPAPRTVKPFSITLPASYLADTDLIETVCLENEKDRPRMVGRISDEKARETKVARSVLAGYVGSYDAGFLGATGKATQLILTIVEGDIPVMRK